ncbi:two-component system response regulator [Secundilactobacillus silagincola]|uniref:Two-component system response regulator n=1 Tax=Secundilactobacillus silagincola TaxID=1714681 RepID=A0A1Z5J1H5_9LACO|nr:response regulator transcription factor [Secundilactobacillus silagincola]GAX07887.1 two-component system response regulator [Secundilactobacillus silagincola]
MKTILIVEDSDDMQGLLTSMLSAEYQVVSAYSGTEGLMLFEKYPVSLILLDRLLPGKSGDEVLQIIRQTSQVPIIMLTALDEASDIADLLVAGANDYVTKPFDINVLKARIMVQLRPTGTDITDEQPLTYQQLTLYPHEFMVKRGTASCSLKKKECEILKLLFMNPQQIFTREQLYEQVWQTPYLGDENTINVHLSNLRNKLAKLDSEHTYIETIWGIGVRLA